MRILKVAPGKAPYAKEMEEGLKAIQREVEGLFQPLSMGDGVILCCNDEGKLNGMQPNRRLGDDIICGPFFLVGDDLLLPDGGADTAVYADVSGAGTVYRAGAGTGAAHRTIYVVRRKNEESIF